MELIPDILLNFSLQGSISYKNVSIYFQLFLTQLEQPEYSHGHLLFCVSTHKNNQLEYPIRARNSFMHKRTNVQ